MDKFIGRRLDGRYEIRELIGVGGMAYVYKAYDTIDDRIVAVKILREEYLANEEFTRRFKNESKAIAILSHPNIVKVYDVSFGERLQYIVMEYIDGITLKEYIDQQKDIKWKETVHFTVQILRALQHAHDKGIVHRDIKPQNIMLLPDGTIKVTDFGIARFARSEFRMTANAEKAIGSVHYISPEQARGEMTDEKADIYSVGVMMYEMLTGRLPFEADSAVSVAIMQMQSEPAAPRSINPDIPEGLEDITLKAMQKDPAKRYQSAAEMLYDIDEFKRNPSIHFEYKYFEDQSPTRFVDAITRIRGGEAAHEDSEEGEGEQKAKKGPPIIPILAAVAGAFVLVTLLFVGATLFLSIGKEEADEVAVENFVGMDYLEVVNNKEYTDKFQFLINRVNSETVPENEIISQDPPAPMKVKLHKEITLTVSIGPQLITVPLVSKNEKEEIIKSRLEEKDFIVERVEQTSEDVPAGCVIKIYPASGEQLPKGSKITMYVSTGAEPLPDQEVPNVKSTSLASAKEALSQKGFVVNDANIVYENHDTYPANYVIRQEPDSGVTLSPGSEVKLVVSSGYRDVKNFPLVLPGTNTPIDIQVYIDGELRPELSKTNIIPNAVGTQTLTLTEQKAEYTVLVYIKASSQTSYSRYAEYTANGRDGTWKLNNRWNFEEPTAPTTLSDRNRRDDDE